MKVVSDFHPRHPISRLCRGLFVPFFQSFLERSEKLCLSLNLILERMLLTDVRLTARFYELMMASVLAISA